MADTSKLGGASTGAAPAGESSLSGAPSPAPNPAPNPASSPTPNPAGAPNPVVISIARDYGAEGHEIGVLLEKHLGIPLYDNELLVRSALSSGVDVGQLASFDEKNTSGPLTFLPDVTDQRTTSERFFQAMRQTILDLGMSRTCIIEGRLSDYILRDNPNLIRVLITAPLEERVHIVSKKRGISNIEGKFIVRSKQKEREKFYTRFSGGKWDMHMGKDLVVDRSVWGREGCCDIISAAYAYRCQHRRG